MLLGTAYRQLGRTEDARRELIIGRGDLPERPDPWAAQVQKFFAGVAADRKRGEALMKAGRLEQAIEIFERLRVKRPRDVSNLGALAIARRRTGQTDEAIVLLHEALDIQPGYDMAHFHLAGAYRDKGASPPDPELLGRALEHADKVVALSPTFAEGHGIRADVLISLGRNEEAVAALGEAIRFDPDSAFWPLRRGALLFEMNEWEAAIPLFETAADLDPRSVQALLALASAHLKLQELEQARSVLLEAARLAPGNGGIEQTLQQIDQALRRREKR
jgi:tetratricopeptide (TPR) repeat protein